MNKSTTTHDTSRHLWLTVCSLLLGVALAPAGEATPKAMAKPLSDGWSLRTGVFPKQEASASIDKGVFTIDGGGDRGGVWVRGTVVEADRAKMTAAFVYKAFKGDFILTARRITYDKRKAHQNCGSGLAAIGDLNGWDTPVATNASDFGGKPFWYRMIRKGDRIGLYEGPDGQRWMASNAGALISGTVYAGLYTEGWDERSMAQYDNVTVVENPTFTYNTTWLGNEFEGGPRNTVGSSMIGLAVTPDGTCITTGVNGEQENEMGRYRNGQTLNCRPGHFVGGSGNAVVVLPDGQGLVAQHGKIQRFDWDGLNGKNGPPVAVTTAKDPLDAEFIIRGIAVHQDEVFVACRPENAILVLDLKTLAKKRSLPFTRPGPLAVDAKGVLWAVEEGWVSGHPYSYPYPKPFRILGLDRQSGKQVTELSGVELPTALCADEDGPDKARLLVADNGVDQQVKVFDVSGTKPKQISTLGSKGGVYAGTPGEMKPGKFNGLTGIGSDAKGNLYVTTPGYPYRVAFSAGMANISQLKAFAPSALGKAEPEALWTLNCPGFNCMGASWDAKTGDVYIGGLARYAFDAKRGLGREWQIAGTTANLRDESDGETLMRTFHAAPDIRWIEGERFLFLRNRIYKLDKNGNLGRLAGLINVERNFLRDLHERREKGAADPFSLDALLGRFPLDPPAITLDQHRNQKDWHYWEWIDGHGGGPLDGKQQRVEYRDLTSRFDVPNELGLARWLDSKHDQWIVGPGADRTIYHRPFSGLKNGVPTWSDEVRRLPAPPIFTRVLTLHYQPERDIMDIGGQTAENPGGYEWQVAEVIRFTNWSSKPVMGARLVFMERGRAEPFGGEGFWQVDPFIDKPSAVSIAGDIAYVPNRTGAIRAYDLTKGNLIEWMDAGPEVFGTSGFFDFADTALKSYEISKAEHLLLRQSNYTIRILAHRWNPQGANSGRLPPAPEICAYPRDGEAELRWDGRTGASGTVTGYQIYRADQESGPYRKLALATGPYFRDPRPNGQPAWYRVATINLVGEGPQSAPIRAGATATAVKRVTRSGAITAEGFDLVTRGNWQGVYGKEAAYLAQDHVPKGAKPGPRRTFTAGWVSGFGVMWGTQTPVETSTDAEWLQSAVMPGMRCHPNASAWWGPTRGEIIIPDGQPRRLTVALARSSTFSFTDPETGAVIHQEQVSSPQAGPKEIAYVAFEVSGRFRLTIDGEPIFALFIDPLPSSK